MNGINPNCTECDGFGWHPNTIRVGYEIPMTKAYKPCQKCNDEYREHILKLDKESWERRKQELSSNPLKQEES